MNSRTLTQLADLVERAYFDAAPASFDGASIPKVAAMIAASDHTPGAVVEIIRLEHRNLTPVDRCRLADRIVELITEPEPAKAPERRSTRPVNPTNRDQLDCYIRPAGRILAVKGRPPR